MNMKVLLEKMFDAVESGSNWQCREITNQLNTFGLIVSFDRVDETRDPFMILFVLFFF